MGSPLRSGRAARGARQRFQGRSAQRRRRPLDSRRRVRRILRSSANRQDTSDPLLLADRANVKPSRFRIRHPSHSGTGSHRAALPPPLPRVARDVVPLCVPGRPEKSAAIRSASMRRFPSAVASARTAQPGARGSGPAALAFVGAETRPFSHPRSVASSSSLHSWDRSGTSMLRQREPDRRFGAPSRLAGGRSLGIPGQPPHVAPLAGETTKVRSRESGHAALLAQPGAARPEPDRATTAPSAGRTPLLGAPFPDAMRTGSVRAFLSGSGRPAPPSTRPYPCTRLIQARRTVPGPRDGRSLYAI